MTREKIRIIWDELKGVVSLVIGAIPFLTNNYYKMEASRYYKIPIFYFKMDFTKITIQLILILLILIILKTISSPKSKFLKENKLVLISNLSISFSVAIICLQRFAFFLYERFNITSKSSINNYFLSFFLFFYCMSVIALMNKNGLEEINELYEKIINIKNFNWIKKIRKCFKKVINIKKLNWIKKIGERFKRIINIKIGKIILKTVKFLAILIFAIFFIFSIISSVFTGFENKKVYPLIYENGKPTMAIISVDGQIYSVVPCQINRIQENLEVEKYELVLYTKYGEKVSSENKKVGERYFDRIVIENKKEFKEENL